MKPQIQELLVSAASAFERDAQLRDALYIDSRDLRGRLHDAVENLCSDLDQDGGKRRPAVKMPAHLPAMQASGVLKEAHAVYVVIPVYNADDAQVVACINSVVQNFKHQDICLVVYANRLVLELPGIDLNSCPCVVFCRPNFSLPQAYNACMEYLRTVRRARDEIVVFMDDDARICADQEAVIDSQIALLNTDAVVAASGHYYDETEPSGFFQHVIHLTHTRAFCERCPKPYCHGGAALMMKAKHFPSGGLPHEGLGGISLNAMLINEADDARLAGDRWFLFNNTGLRVFHPRKSTMLQWTATYLSYVIAWELALSWLNPARQRIWRKKLQQSSMCRQELLVGLAQDNASYRSQLALANLLLTRYYKEHLNRNLSYESFKSMNLQTHHHLKDLA